MQTVLGILRRALVILLVLGLTILAAGPSWAGNDKNDCKKHKAEEEAEEECSEGDEDDEQACSDDETDEAEDAEEESADQEDGDKKDKKEKSKHDEEDECGDDETKESDDEQAEEPESNETEDKEADGKDADEVPDDPSGTSETKATSARRSRVRETNKSRDSEDRAANRADRVRKGTIVLASEYHRSPQQRAQVDESLSVTISSDTPTSSPGDSITYSVQVSYQGDQELTDVVITAEIPSGAVFLALGAGGGVYDEASKTITWTYSEFVSGQAVILSFDVSVPTGITADSLLARVSVESDQLEAQSAETSVSLGAAGSNAGAQEGKKGAQRLLARTGSDPRATVALALVLIVLGAFLCRVRVEIVS